MPDRAAQGSASRAVQELFALASDVMGADMAALLRDSNEETLKRSDIAQPAITLVNLAAAALLKERGIVPAACAGFSLGEYAALVTAGIISVEDCFTLVKLRGKFMQEAADRLTAEPGGSRGGEAGNTGGSGDSPGTAPGMAAVIGLAPEQVESLIGEWKTAGLADLYGANYNSPRQVVVSGTAAALAAATEKFKAAGAKRVIPLPVAGPFHSPLMADAAAAFAPALERVNFHDPLIPCFSNVSGGRIVTGTEAKTLALRHITEPVRWIQEEGAIAGLEGLAAALETGPGKALRGFWKDSGSNIPCYAAGTLGEIGALPAGPGETTD
jgi:[acyl-carrier-protein] S-malonyltransferase